MHIRVMKLRSTYLYILDGCTPVAVDDLKVWARWIETANRQVEETFIDEARVSTVFLGLDHNFYFSSAPILFETMVFGGPLDQEQRRYPTWDDAVVGHHHMIGRVQRAYGVYGGRRKPLTQERLRVVSRSQGISSPN